MTFRRFAITPGDARDLPAWLPSLAGRATDVIVREPRLAEPILRRTVEIARAHGLTAWLHAGNPASVGLADDLGCGVHLPASHPPVGVPHGRSCHDGPALDRAFAEGASYALLSPVFAPGSKPDDPRPTLGIDGFLALAAGRPVAALGGIDDDRAEALRARGAWGAAGIGWFAAAL